MAATITNLTGATSTAGGTDTITASGAYTVAVGDGVVVMVAAPNSGASGAFSPVSVEDSDGINTYTQRVTSLRDPGATGDGTQFAVFTCIVTDAVTSGDVTATFDDTSGSKVIQVYRFRPGTGEVVEYITADSNGNTGSASSVTTGTTVSITGGDTIFCGAAVEANGSATGDSDTTNGSWSAVVNRTADNGGDNTSTTLPSQYKTVTATGTQLWSATYGSAKDFAASYVVLRSKKVVTATPGSYSVSGQTVSLERGRRLTALGGSYDQTGTDVSFSATGAKIVNAEPGSYDHTGTDVSLLQAWKLSLEAGQYDVTGADVSTLHQWKVAADGGTYETTGTDAALKVGFKFTADAGSHTVTGTDIALSASAAKAISAEGGSYAYTGTDVTFSHGLEVAADAGSYAVNGTDVTFSRELTFFYDAPGSYEHSGSEVTFTKTASAPVPIVGTLVGAPFSHSLIIRRPPATLGVTDNSANLRVSTTTPTLRGKSHTHTLKVRL